ncbi:hypothetical protein E2C01_032013 [Portunus trituberculatus]|uniref:Uncharacterized protein n=1 Tax=Portunus trituberculatus TaxID=210409 RepID=A0A5B7EZ74_PORTR|nr:hypothetical protein [Portunus trituberculatus]
MTLKYELVIDSEKDKHTYSGLADTSTSLTTEWCGEATDLPRWVNKHQHDVTRAAEWFVFLDNFNSLDIFEMGLSLYKQRQKNMRIPELNLKNRYNEK